MSAYVALPRGLGWVLASAVRWAFGSPGEATVLLALAWLAWPTSASVALAAIIIAVVARVLWLQRTAQPAWLLRKVVEHSARRRLRRDWSVVTEAAGFDDEPPLILRLEATWPYVRVWVRPGLGQTLDDWQRSVEVLRMGFHASRVRADSSGVRDLVITMTIDDPLISATRADVPGECDLGSVTVGRREDGQPWKLAIGPHTLVAGSSGAGKGSVFWSFAFGLASEVRRGSVRLHAVDLKGGMEVLMGADLFSTVATTPRSAVALLEWLVDQMVARTHRYAGHVRSHTPSVDEPLDVVMIDELAALTAYLPDRELQRRAESALNLLCSQGRAPGFMVFACIQDPRKEVIPSRGLFTQMVGLRLKDVHETAMVLGDFALDSGALCHRIPRSQPGTGYVCAEDLEHPVRVRSHFASDDEIRRVSIEYSTPWNIEVPPLREQAERRRLPRPTEPRHDDS